MHSYSESLKAIIAAKDGSTKFQMSARMFFLDAFFFFRHIIDIMVTIHTCMFLFLSIIYLHNLTR